MITDRATYAYRCDVYLLEEYRGQGLGRWLMETVMAHPDLQGLRRFSLVTRNAHGLYAPYPPNGTGMNVTMNTSTHSQPSTRRPGGTGRSGQVTEG